MEPKHQNSDSGFHYTVSEEQIEQHKKRTIEEIFAWLEETNRFVFMVQTPEERKRSRLLKGKPYKEF